MIRIAMLRAFFASLVFVTGCAHDDIDNLRLLNARADYEAEGPAAQPLTLPAAEAGEDGVTVPVRLPPKVVHIWMHAHETPDHEYFWGAWLSVVVSGEAWGTQYVPGAPAPKARKPAKPKTKNPTKAG